jgi:excinuclease UvrABC nuclease subunit
LNIERRLNVNLNIDLPKRKYKYSISDKDKILNEGGVYCFYSKQGDLLYVGKSKDVKKRMNSHLKGRSNTNFIYKAFDNIIIYYIKDEAEMEIYETYIINKFRPLFNTAKRYYTQTEQEKVNAYLEVHMEKVKNTNIKSRQSLFGLKPAYI